ncbi:MAG: hypothetical protein JXB08_01325 [Bacilli bacterium]|nr:hypothetical protein [Bacilli bacterium]
MSAIVLVFALIATVGSTYAWFTVSNQVTVNTINITVESSESLLIRTWRTGEAETEGQVYGDYLYGDASAAWTLDDFSSVADITDSPYYASYTAWRLLPVTALAGETSGDTTYDSIDITTLRYLTSATSATRPLAAATANNASGHFLEFKFWLLRPSGTNTNILFDYTLAGTYADAMAVGIIGDDNLDAAKYTVFGSDLDYGFAWSASDAGFNDDATDSAVNFNGTNGTLDTALAAIEGTEGTTVVNYLGTANVPELVTVRVWLEGWDADATNAVMGATFTLAMTFTLQTS